MERIDALAQLQTEIEAGTWELDTGMHELEHLGEDAVMRNEGEPRSTDPAPPKSLLAVLATLAPLDEDFPPIPRIGPGSRRDLMRCRPPR